MPRFIVKPVKEQDFYVEWSTIADAPTAYGSKKELMELLGPKEGTAERFDRADKFGTSSYDRWFGWDERLLLVNNLSIPNDRYAEGVYEVPRENLRALCERGEEADPTDLLVFTVYEEDV